MIKTLPIGTFFKDAPLPDSKDFGPNYTCLVVVPELAERDSRWPEDDPDWPEGVFAVYEWSPSGWVFTDASGEHDLQGPEDAARMLTYLGAHWTILKVPDPLLLLATLRLAQPPANEAMNQPPELLEAK